MRVFVLSSAVVVAVFLTLSGTPVAAGRSEGDREKAYGRADVALVSAVRDFTAEARNRFPINLKGGGPSRSAVSYKPDGWTTIGGRETSHSQYLYEEFAMLGYSSGLSPVNATGSDQQTELLLVCNGTSRLDHLYGYRTARMTINSKNVAIRATARDFLEPGDLVNYEPDAEPVRAEISRARLDEKVDAALWTSFFEAGPAVYDGTLPVRHKACFVEAYQGQKYAFLWRADYHDDAAAKVIDALWELLNNTVPARPVPQFFPSPVFFPAEDLRTPAGTYRMTESEVAAWHNEWDALFSKRLLQLDEKPLFGTRPKVAVFRHLTASAQGTDDVITMSFDMSGSALTTLKSYEFQKCMENQKGVGLDYVIRKFSAPGDLARQIYSLLTSDEFKAAAGDVQIIGGFDGAEHLYEFLKPDGTYIARKRWSPENIFEKITDLTHKIRESPAAKAEGAIVFRETAQGCPD